MHPTTISNYLTSCYHQHRGRQPLLIQHDTAPRSVRKQVRIEQERVAALVAGRRQREAALVGKFDSDEIYNLEDEHGLAMQQAQRESRCRVLALCEGRKLADTTALITDDLIRELQTFLTRCVRAPVLLYHSNT